jgi:hypothetical protein
VDGHYVHNYTRGAFDWENINSRTKSGKNANPSEEFVIGDINAVHRSITQIEFVSFRYTERDAALLDVVQAYGQKWKIGVVIDPSVFTDFEDYKIRLQNLRVPQKYKRHPDIRKWFPDYRPARKHTG